MINKTLTAEDGPKLIAELRKLGNQAPIKHVRYRNKEAKLLRTKTNLADVEEVILQSEIEKILNANAGHANTMYVIS